MYVYIERNLFAIVQYTFTTLKKKKTLIVLLIYKAFPPILLLPNDLSPKFGLPYRPHTATAMKMDTYIEICMERTYVI